MDELGWGEGRANERRMEQEKWKKRCTCLCESEDEVDLERRSSLQNTKYDKNQQTPPQSNP